MTNGDVRRVQSGQSRISHVRSLGGNVSYTVLLTVAGSHENDELREAQLNPPMYSLTSTGKLETTKWYVVRSSDTEVWKIN